MLQYWIPAQQISADHLTNRALVLVILLISYMRVIFLTAVEKGDEKLVLIATVVWRYFRGKRQPMFPISADYLQRLKWHALVLPSVPI